MVQHEGAGQVETPQVWQQDDSAPACAGAWDDAVWRVGEVKLLV